MRARVFVSQVGNQYMVELATLLAHGLRDLGVDTELRRQGRPQSGQGTVDVVVAPHEYFPLLDPGKPAGDADGYVAVLTEEPGTSAFDVSTTYVEQAAAVLDIGRSGVKAWWERGVEAHLLRLGYHPSWDRWSGRPLDRPLGVVFMGSPTTRREARLAALAPRLARCDVRILLDEGRCPQPAPPPNTVWAGEKFELLAATRVLLNLHRGESRSFEWHRALGAMANGCVVLSEPATHFEPLEPFRHFLMVDAGALGDHLTMLESCPDLLARIRSDAYEFAKSELDFTAGLRPLLPVLQEAASGGSRRSSPTVPTAAGPSEAPAAVAELAPPFADVARLLKQHIVGQTRLRRRVDRLECRLRWGTDQHESISTSKSFEWVRPGVSVVIPSYNYAETLSDAIHSVFRSTGVLPEVVVVDDHSDDDSVEVAERLLAEHPLFPVKLVGLAANIGLSEARNLGFEHARTDEVFLLDADDLIYPGALRKLTEALEASGAAFSYPMIECFGAEQRLLSEFPWDVGRLTRAPYIDAMSLVRKDAWKAVGGFRADLGEMNGGWEDYAFWLSLAGAGYEGCLVPEILGRCRIHDNSMTNVTNLNTSDVMRTLRAAFPSLPWPA